MIWSTIRLSLRVLFHRIGILLAGNVLWILVSLPLITLPAATGALFYLVHRVVLEERDLDPHATRIGDFWTGLRLHWLRSTWLGLLNFAALLVLVISLRFYIWNPQEILRFLAGPTIIIFIAWLMLQLYLYPLLVVHPKEPVGAIIRRAFFLALGYPFDSLLMVILLLVLTGISVALAGPVLFLLFSAVALIQTLFLRLIRVSRNEIPSSRVR
jgi:uncharacterized membrane protein YesL